MALALALAAPYAAQISAQEEQQQPGSEPEEPAPPEGVRRPRPKTAEEERQYKLDRTRSDPFLNAPPPGPLPQFNPAEWLSSELALDRSLYLIQSPDGQLRGTYSIAIDRRASSAGDFVHVTKEDSQTKERVELLLYAETLRPRRITIHTMARAAGGAALEEQQRIEVDYRFDRILLSRQAGPVQTTERLRQLPYSFDVEELPLLVRRLLYSELEQADSWPFEALVTQPRQKSSSQLRIEKPKRATLLSAEPAEYPVFELRMQLGERESTWWVERFAPYRLVRFSDGELTYSLHEYAALNSY